jgi:hypothetical protein
MARFKHLRAEAEERFLRLHVKAWVRAATFAGGNLVRFWRMADSRAPARLVISGIAFGLAPGS